VNRSPSPIEAARQRHSLAEVAARTEIWLPTTSGKVTVRFPMPSHGHPDRTPFPAPVSRRWHLVLLRLLGPRRGCRPVGVADRERRLASRTRDPRFGQATHQRLGRRGLRQWPLPGGRHARHRGDGRSDSYSVGPDPTGPRRCMGSLHHRSTPRPGRRIPRRTAHRRYHAGVLRPPSRGRAHPNPRSHPGTASAFRWVLAHRDCRRRHRLPDGGGKGGRLLPPASSDPDTRQPRSGCRARRP